MCQQVSKGSFTKDKDTNAGLTMPRAGGTGALSWRTVRLECWLCSRGERLPEVDFSAYRVWAARGGERWKVKSSPLPQLTSAECLPTHGVVESLPSPVLRSQDPWDAKLWKQLVTTLPRPHSQGVNDLVKGWLAYWTHPHHVPSHSPYSLYIPPIFQS